MKIIAIGAHLDDIELSCGGTLVKAIKNGHKVKMLVMSDSSYTNFDGKVLRTRKEALKEGKQAIKYLGVSDFEILNFQTKDIPYNSKSVEAIDKVISAFNPDLILSHWVFDTHQDHRNTALSTLAAGRYKNNILMYEPFPPSSRSYFPFRPQVYIDITETLKDKILAIKKHKSQYQKYGGENWVKAIEAKARANGAEACFKYAEAFEPIRLEFKI
jgi:LmbE family N-acetylglucosaminyl deacetylase